MNETINDVYKDFLKETMQRLSNVIYEGSMRKSITKDVILNALIGTVEEYNNATGENIIIRDFRK